MGCGWVCEPIGEIAIKETRIKLHFTKISLTYSYQIHLLHIVNLRAPQRLERQFFIIFKLKYELREHINVMQIAEAVTD